jgi:hypothetical protein
VQGGPDRRRLELTPRPGHKGKVRASVTGSRARVERPERNLKAARSKDEAGIPYTCLLLHNTRSTRYKDAARNEHRAIENVDSFL